MFSIRNWLGRGIDPRKHDAVAGCLLGGALGDALGSRHEGQRRPVEVVWGPPWAVSDDTQLTLATCEALIEACAPDPAAIAAGMLRWFQAGRLTGLGSATLGALQGLAAGGHWALVGRRGEMAAGNGAAMRIAPLALWTDPGTDKGRRIVQDVCRITHHSDEAYAGALAVALAVRLAFTRSWSRDGTLLGRVAEALPDSAVRDRLAELAAPREPARTVAEVAAELGCSGHVVESVPLALHAAQRAGAIGFEAAVAEVVGAGGDADTNGAIAGQVAGALVGTSGLPREWVEKLPGAAEIREIARRLAERLA